MSLHILLQYFQAVTQPLFFAGRLTIDMLVVVESSIGFIVQVLDWTWLWFAGCDPYGGSIVVFFQQLWCRMVYCLSAWTLFSDDLCILRAAN